jgi:hypothetical protein
MGPLGWLLVLPFLLAGALLLVMLWALFWACVAVGVLVWATVAYARHHGPADPSWWQRIRWMAQAIAESRQSGPKPPLHRVR